MAITKLKKARLGRLNNTEYNYFSAQFIAQVVAAGVETLHVPTDKFETYQAHHEKMVDLANLSRISNNTEKIVELRNEIRTYALYLLRGVKNAGALPAGTKRTAGVELSNLLSPSKNIYKLPQRQLVQAVNQVLKDLSEETAAAHIATLGLADDVAELSSRNARLGILLESRSVERQANKGEDTRLLREEMDAAYEEIMLTVYSFRVSAPTDELVAFIDSVNRLIGDADTAYNMRTSHTSGKSSTTDSDTTQEETPDTSVAI